MTGMHLLQRSQDLVQQLHARGFNDSSTLTVEAALLGSVLRAIGDTSGQRAVDGLVDGVLRGAVGVNDARLALQQLTPTAKSLSRCQPFAHPVHWGAFTLYGRDFSLTAA